MDGLKRFAGAVLFVSATGMAQNPAQSSVQSPVQGPVQGPVQSTELVVTGHAGQAAVIQRNGHWYVDVESLARATGGTLGFAGSRIVLTLPPAAGQGATPQPASSKPVEEKGFSRDFLRAGIEGMSVIREWRAAIENAVRTNSPVEESWVSGYRRTADNRMSLASAAATTESDKKAVPLLDNQLNNMRQLSDRFLAMRQSLTFVSTDTLDNDPLDQKILACAQGLAALAAPGGMFEDVAACH